MYENIKTFPEKFKYVYSKITPQKFLNLISSILAQKFGIFISDPQPIEVQLETVKGCNFKCIMCDAWKFPLKFLSFEQSKAILQNFKNSIFLHPYGIGEPFLNKDIYKIVKYASQNMKFIVGITSNFSVIDPKKALNMGANQIMVSIDSINDDTFFQIRHGNLKIVKKNLLNILHLKGNRKYPLISIRTLLFKENINEIDKIVEFGLSAGVKRFYFQTPAEGYSLKKANEISKEDIDIVYDVLRRYKNKAEIYLYLWDDKAKGSIPTGYCFNAFFIGTIGYNGEVYTCCRQFGNKEASLGNILENPKNALKNRILFLKKFRYDPPDFCKGCETYCRMCDKKISIDNGAKEKKYGMKDKGNNGVKENETENKFLIENAK